jgi:hypothetical protein
MARQNKRKNKTNKKTKQKGGYGAGARPIGQSWEGGNPETWPGVAVANNTLNMDGMTSSNHLAKSPYGIAVGGVEIAKPGVSLELKKTMTGGTRKYKKNLKKNNKRKTGKRMVRKQTKKHNKTKKRVHKMKGGFFGPQSFLNFGHEIKYQTKGFFDNFMGNQQPVNPSPLEQPINKMPSRVISPTPINLARSINKADI